eukprot:GFUD01002580.1.p1 GENE.GFUD01002580.1~~GFUD01002580.1.p1  ORF type:complete len:591 (+),score=137.53 GFUD01002580.1:172-1944(+)
MECNTSNFLKGETNLLSPIRTVSPSNSVQSDYSDDSGIVPSVELIKNSDDSATDDLEDKNVSDWGTNARKSWISRGQIRGSGGDSHLSAEETYEPDCYESEVDETQSFLEISDQIYKDPPRRGENYRRFSTACAPIRTLSEYVNIPEVVITSHDDDIEDENPSQLNPKHRMLRRSMSSPDGVLSHLSQETCLKLASLAMNLQEEADYVTLEDVEKFKLRRKKSGASSINSLNDERFQLTDETWSYTNFSSSQASETRYADSFCLSDGEDIDNKSKEAEGNDAKKKDNPVTFDFAAKHETPKISSWGKLRKMVRWIPFIQIYRKKKYPWVQLAGHSGNFLKGIKQGTVLKKHNLAEESCYLALMKDILQEVVPQYYRRTNVQGRDYMEMQCCLSQFVNPNLMDIKMGTRTFLQAETSVSKPRTDLYEKMVKEDPDAPTEDEARDEAVSKHRYLDWRDCISSSRSIGFRIEGITVDGKSSRDYKTTREYEQIHQIFDSFSPDRKIRNMYLERLRLIKNLCEKSSFFASHELIGSSLLFVHDYEKASVWLIDFEKTRSLEGSASISHDRKWELNNHEDGYLIGLNSVIQMFSS